MRYKNIIILCILLATNTYAYEKPEFKLIDYIGAYHDSRDVI